MTYRIEKLSPDLDFGVRIHGLAEQDIQSEEVRKQLRTLWIQEGLVVFTDCQVTPDFHINLSRCFGDLERHPTREIWIEGCPELIRIKSGPGKEILWEVDGEARSGWIPWHMDLIYVERVNHGGILRAITIPSWGGKTGFLDRAGAYERLPDGLKQRIENLHVGYKMHIDVSRNRYATRSKLRQLQSSAFQESMEEREDRDFPPVVYPLVFRHPENGRKILNLSPLFLTHVVGMADAESDALINELIDLLDDQRYTYHHEWKPTDMVLWDNWRMLHSVTGTSPEEVREMHRTTIAGDYALGRKLSAFTQSGEAMTQ